MTEVTLYTSSEGKTQPIVELNPFHLVNALIKVTNEANKTPIGEEFSLLIETQKALKAEVLRRLLPPKEEEVKAEDIPF